SVTALGTIQNPPLILQPPAHFFHLHCNGYSTGTRGVSTQPARGETPAGRQYETDSTQSVSCGCWSRWSDWWETQVPRCRSPLWAAPAASFAAPSPPGRALP